MKVNLPIPAGWRLYCEDIYRRLHRQLTSPWTKLSLLLLLAILVTRKDFTLSFTLDAGSLFGLSGPSVFDSAAPEDRTAASLVAYNPERRAWTARERAQLAYVSRYGGLARRQMTEHGIPASITMAQGLLESGVGESTLARNNNNHFGLKCFSKTCTKGHCSNHSDDHHKDFFRIFATPEDSYEAHATLLQKERYRPLFRLDDTDYQGWARGLSKAGYATDPRYADKLIALIENLGLYRLDKDL